MGLIIKSWVNAKKMQYLGGGVNRKGEAIAEFFVGFNNILEG